MKLRTIVRHFRKRAKGDPSFLEKTQKKTGSCQGPGPGVTGPDLVPYMVPFLDELSDGVMVTDSRMGIVYVNPAALQILRLSAYQGTMKGRAVYEVVRLKGLMDCIDDPPPRGTVRRFSFSTHWGEALDLLCIKFHSGFLVIVKKEDRDSRIEESSLRSLIDASHQLRTPLAALRGYAETLLQSKDITTQTRHEFIQAIYKNVEKLNSLMKDILLLSRIEAGIPKEEVAIFDLNEIVFDQVESLMGLAEESGIELILLDSMGPIFVKGHPRLTGIAIQNIVENAIVYSDQGGKVKVSIVPEGQMAIVQVEDWGPGIPMEDQERIFQRFFRVKETKDRYAPGTGLGLSIGRKVARLQGGEIQVKSQWGRGSTFRFFVPKADVT